MSVNRFALLAASLMGAWGCSSLLGLDEFEDRSPDGGSGAGGDGASGGSAGSSASGGSSGSSGSSGSAGAAGAPAIECQPDGSIFVVFDQDVFQPGGTFDDDSLYVVRVPGDDVAHVVISGTRAGEPAVAVKTVLDASGTLGSELVFSVPSSTNGSVATDAKLVAGTAASSSLALFGWAPMSPPDQPSNTWVRVSMSVDGGGVSGGDDTMHVPTTGPCLDGGIRSAAFDLSAAGAERVAATCDESNARSLVAGPVNAPDEVTVTGLLGDNELDVEDYVFSGGVHLFQLAGSTYRFGGDSVANNAKHALNLGGPTNGLALVRRAGGAPGAIVIAGRTLTSVADSELRTAALDPSEYPILDVVEPAEFVAGGSVDGAHLAARLSFGVEAERLAAAAVNKDDSSVRLHYLSRGGVPLVLGYEVHTPAASAAVTQAAAMPLDEDDTLVVWVESDGSAIAVRGLIVECSEP